MTTAASRSELHEAIVAWEATQEAQRREQLTALIDQRIELALDAARRKSLDLYRKGRDGIPEPADVPRGDVDRVVDGAGGGLVGPESGDQVGEVAHGLAPSRDGEGSVGGSPAAELRAHTAGDDATGGPR